MVEVYPKGHVVQSPRCVLEDLLQLKVLGTHRRKTPGTWD